MRRFPLADMPTAAESGIESFTIRYAARKSGRLHAVATSEMRAPRAGEWYISGAIPEAYRAPNDLPTVFRIAILAKG